METFKMHDSVNLLVTSSHGFATLPIHNLYFLDDFLDVDYLIDKLVDSGAWMMIYPKFGKEFQVIQ